MPSKKPAKKPSARRAKPADRPPLRNPEDKVRWLLHLTGAGDIGKQIVDNLMDTLAAQGTFPAGFAEKYKERAEPHELVDRIVPVYLRHCDEEMLDAAIALFESAPGRRFARAQLAITQESSVIGQQWGLELAQRAMRALEEDQKGIG